MTRRLVAVFGLAAGCAAVFMADWPLTSVPGWAWKVLAALSVLALLSMRSLPRSTVDDRELRRRVGDSAVNRLIGIQTTAIFCLFLAILPALLIAPLLRDLGARHIVLEACASFGLCALGAFAQVEARFRNLVAAAGLVFTAS